MTGIGERFLLRCRCRRAGGWGGVQPPALFDGLIGGVIPYDKGEDGTEVAVFFYDMALAFSDVRLQDGGGRPVVSPLGGIAVPAHLGPGVGVYL